jgi:colanic acid/amylovoran biosynthesis glycosyltransferase
MKYRVYNKKIGIVLSSTPGYSETFFKSKIKGLQESGYDVTLFVDTINSEFDLCAIKKSNSIHIGNFYLLFFNFPLVFIKLLFFPKRLIRYYNLEKNRGCNTLSFFKKCYLNEKIITSDLDWLHFGFATLAIGKENLAKSMKSKMSVSFRGYDINVYPLKYKNCYDLLWKRVDKVHSISKFLIERAVLLGLNKKTPFEIIYPAIDLDKLPTRQVLENDEIVISTVARFNWIKGLDIAIDGMKLLKEEGVKFQYHIIGTGTNQAEIERYKFQVHQLNLGKSISFHDQLSHNETLKLISKSHIYLQPSLNEGFCNSVLEAQAMGIPCLVSDVGAMKENIVEGKTGFVFNAYDCKDLVVRLLFINSIPSSNKKTMSINSKERVRTLFSLKKQEEDFLKFYM